MNRKFFKAYIIKVLPFNEITKKKIINKLNSIYIDTYKTFLPSSNFNSSLQSNSAIKLKHSLKIQDGIGEDPPSGSSVNRSQIILTVSLTF